MTKILLGWKVCWPAPVSEAPPARMYSSGRSMGMALWIPDLISAPRRTGDGMHQPSLPKSRKQTDRRLCDLAIRFLLCDYNGGYKNRESSGRARNAWPAEAEI